MNGFYFGGKSNCFDKFRPQLLLCRQTFLEDKSGPHTFGEKLNDSIF